MNTSLSDAAKADRRALREIYERAFILFLDKLEIAPTPEHFPLPYTLCDKAKDANWSHMPLADHLVAGDLSETINQLNAWCEWLMHLSVWTDVLDHFDEQKAWNIQHSYVDPLAQICLMQPSSARDRFGHIATNAIHQANLCTIEGYPDQLKQDGQKHPLSRKQLEGQISEIGKHWSGTTAFLDALVTVDSKAYRDATMNYRNLASHAIAPRFRFGITNTVVRSWGSISKLVDQGNGTSLLVEDATQMRASYGFGGTEALDLRSVYQLSHAEFSKTVTTFDAYSHLLQEMLSAM